VRVPAVAPPVAAVPAVVAPPAEATLTVTVQPWGEAAVDGRRVVLGRPVHLAPGVHTVVASQGGARSTSRRVTLAAGQSEHVRMAIPR
jgi:hypothetical protein